MDKRKLIFFCTLTFSIALEIYVRSTGMFGTFPPIDNVMHFFWGLNIFLFFVAFLRWKPWQALLAVFVWQMLWEALEIFGDQIIDQPGWNLDPFFFDGLKDTAMDLGGALLAWGIVHLLPAGEARDSPIRTWMSFYAIGMLPMIVLGSILSLARGSSTSIFALIWIVAAIPAAAVLSKLTRARQA